MAKIDMLKLRERLTETANRDLRAGNIAGAAIAVIQGGEMLYRENFGYSDYMTKTPLNDLSIFRLASMTKPVSAVAALIAEEMGYFSLSDRAADYFPEIADMYVGKLADGKVVPDHKPKEELKLYHFLCHTSGFMSNSPICTAQMETIPSSAYSSNRAAIDYVMKNTCLTLEPTESTGYSAYQAFDVIGVLIEDKSGMKYADFLNMYIFQPLGMTDTTYHPTEEQWQRLVTMSDKVTPMGRVNVDMGRHTFECFPTEYTCAGAGLVGTLSDYVNFAEMLRCEGYHNGKRIVSAAAIRKMRTPMIKPSAVKSGSTDVWGLGVRVCNERHPYLAAGTYGWSGAYGTHFFVDPENDITAIYMKNSRWNDSAGCGKTGLIFEQNVSDSLI
ncbi:MAG: beta-lactamase family protein [Clostridia bacterium]|nr:beta-lactamase family protein [Clostridia bacterium]